MDVKEAVAVAKRYVSELYSEEATADPTLEEVRFDEVRAEWRITIGVRRPSNYIERDFRDPLGGKSRLYPDYKVVQVSDKTGKALAIVNREPGTN